jgi:hypothetical protein
MVNQSEFLFDTSSSFLEKREAPRISVRQVKTIIFNQQLTDYLTDVDSRLSLSNSLPMLSPDMKCIVIISCLADMQMFISAWSQRKGQGGELQMVVVYTDASILKKIQHQLTSMLPQSAFLLYMPLWVAAKRIDNVAQGLEPLIDRYEAIQFILARLEDTQRFGHMVFRARFDEAGLNRAYANKEDEYSSDAVDYLATHFEPLLTCEYAYSFKRYIGFTESTLPSPTILDALNNRGLLIPRALEPYELLGEWYKAQQGRDTRNQLQEHLQSV